MNFKEFKAEVSKGLPSCVVRELKSEFRLLYKSKFSVADAKEWLNCFEEVNPEVDEYEALQSMLSLCMKYRDSIKLTQKTQKWH